MTSHLGKRQRVNSMGQELQPSYYNPAYPPAGNPTPQPRSISHNDVWATIRTLDENFIREMLFHAAVGNSSQPQLLLKVVEVHDARLREQAERIEAHRRAEEARSNHQERERVLSFDNYALQISAQLGNDPADGKASHISYGVFENNIMPKIKEIQAKASSPNINFMTRYNGLEALRKIAEAICVNSKGALGAAIAFLFVREDAIEEAMLSILKAMPKRERDYLCHIKADELEWWEKMEALWELGHQRCNGDDLFKRMDEVVALVKDEGNERNSNQNQTDALLRNVPPGGNAVGGSAPMHHQNHAFAANPQPVGYYAPGHGYVYHQTAVSQQSPMPYNYSS